MFGPVLRHRRSMRIPGYNYAQAGAYYLTMCTVGRICHFGDAVNDVRHLSDVGRMAEMCWRQIPEHFPTAQIDAFLVMPDHIHGIILIHGEEIGVDGRMSSGDSANAAIGRGVGAENFLPLPRSSVNQFQRPIHRSVGMIVKGFKIGVTKWCRGNAYLDFAWQRNYYEHVVRDQNDLHRIRQYIIDNPMNWDRDRNNPISKGLT